MRRTWTYFYKARDHKEGTLYNNLGSRQYFRELLTNNTTLLILNDHHI